MLVVSVGHSMVRWAVVVRRQSAQSVAAQGPYVGLHLLLLLLLRMMVGGHHLVLLVPRMLQSVRTADDWWPVLLYESIIKFKDILESGLQHSQRTPCCDDDCVAASSPSWSAAVECCAPAASAGATHTTVLPPARSHGDCECRSMCANPPTP